MVAVAAEIVVEPVGKLDRPESPLEETVGRRLPVEFDNGNGGADGTD